MENKKLEDKIYNMEQEILFLKNKLSIIEKKISPEQISKELALLLKQQARGSGINL